MFGQLDENRKRARYVASFLRRRLVHVNLQLLYDCTFRCRICDFWKSSYQDAPRLSAGQVKLIADKLAQIGPQIVSIGGGEPLLHPKIVDIVKTLSADHFPVMICNGWFVTPKIAQDLFASGMHEISVSVDYASSQKHDEQRGVEGAFDRAIAALKVLKTNRTKPHQRVHMISVVLDDNLADVEELIRLCRKMGITYLVTLYSDCRGRKHLKNMSADVSQHLLKLKRKYPEFVALRGYLGNFTKAIEERGIGPCYAGKNLCNIDSQGEVSLCIDRLDDSVGNILSDEVHQLEKKLLAKHRNNNCRSCWTSCRGSIETLMYGRQPISNIWDYYQMTKSIGLG
jgi:MoaA/NifB/PqqE/SkfB family radical SAM enzyme